MLKYKCIDRDITYSCMYLYVFFIRITIFTCCWMSFEAVLGNKEFELVVFGVTFAVVTRRLASGHGVSVLSVGDR
jgi:hypothetical protein